MTVFDGSRDLKQLIRDLFMFVDEAVDFNRLSENQIARMIQDAYSSLMITALTLYPFRFLEYKDYVFTGTDTPQELPGNIYRIICLCVPDTDTATIFNPGWAKAGIIENPNDREYGSAYIVNETISAFEYSGTLRLIYSRRPPSLHYGQAAAGTANTLTFGSTIIGTKILSTDHYKNGYIALLTVSEGEVIARETHRITGNTAAGVVTIADTFTTAPGAGAYYSIIPEIRKEFDNLILWEAIKRSSAWMKKISEGLDIYGTIRELKDQYTMSLSHENTAFVSKGDWEE